MNSFVLTSFVQHVCEILSYCCTGQYFILFSLLHSFPVDEYAVVCDKCLTTGSLVRKKKKL